jgi:hypothetical protein
MERMLAIGIEYQSQQNMPLSGAVFHRKARHLYEDVVKERMPFDAVRSVVIVFLDIIHHPVFI